MTSSIRPRLARGFAAVAAAALLGAGSLLFAAPAAAEPIPVGDVAIIGTPELGNELTVETSGWPVGTSLTYEWFYNGGEFGGAIEGETGDSYTVTADVLGYWIGVLVTGTLDGYESDWNSDLTTDVAFTPELPAAAPPVADSADLGDVLVGPAAPQSHDAAGLPAAVSGDQSGTLYWGGGDSFVDVYLYSSPVLVGTFPVVGGAVDFSLSASLLAAAGPGAHTLVFQGQTSGALQSVAITVVALAATGVDATMPLIAGGSLLLLGGALVLVRRRVRA